MDSRHKTALLKNNVLIVNDLMVDEHFLAHLQEAEILSDNHVDEIMVRKH